MKKTGVQHRITRVYLLQLLLISLTTVLGVWATANIIEQVLVKQALIKVFSTRAAELALNSPRRPAFWLVLLAILGWMAGLRVTWVS